ncbi:hypothetical protein FACS1894133_1750 [Clostridia bacterium]|nr:hypothetical protein FACS1894133_1750 [Clostridia bacterium]
MLIKSKYKTTAMIHCGDNYSAFRAVDIEDRDKTEYIINVYENEAGRHYVECYTRLRHCADFKETFLDGGRLFSVFGLHSGDNIDNIFRKGRKFTWDERVDYAHNLFHLALTVSDYPYEFACAALLSRNMCVVKSNAEDKKIAVNYMASPFADAGFEMFIELLIGQVRKIFPKRYTSCNAEIEFTQLLYSRKTMPTMATTSMVRLYAEWLSYKKRITAEYENLYSKKGFDKIMAFAIMNILRAFKKRSPVKF